jgi:HK97 family phage major capsid protein
MSDIVKMDKAALEALVERKLREAHDAAAGGTPATNLNTRGAEEGEPSPNAGAGAWRGSVRADAPRQSSLKPEVAKDIMRWFRSVVQNDYTEQRAAMSRIERATGGVPQSVGVSADGGTTLPTPFVTEVLIDLPKVTPFADSNIVRIVPMENETLRWTKVTSRPANPPRVKEGGQYTKSGVTFAPITLVAKKIGEIIPFTEEILMSNAIGMVQVISGLVADAFAFKYNSLVTSGLGDADEPEGVLTNSEVTSVAFVNTNAGTKYDSLVDFQHSLKSQYRKLESVFMFNDLDVAIIRKIKDTQNRPLWVDGLGAMPDTLFGRPVIENPDLPQGTALFGNFKRGYVIGKREGMTIDVNSSGADWEKDIRNYKFRERWDGRVHDAKAFVKLTGIAN